jgi:hypothetical protein
MHLSNLITGIAGVGASIQTAASGKKRVDYSSENTLLTPAVPRNQPLAGTDGYSDRCAICFRPQRLEGKNFEIKRGIRKIQRFKISASYLPVMAFGTPPAMGGSATWAELCPLSSFVFRLATLALQ